MVSETLVPAPPSATADLNRILLAKISPNPRNPRGKLGPKDVEDLVASVRTHGVLVPLIVREEGKGFVVVAGHRRLAAAREADLEEVPCVVLPSDKAQDLELALVENEQREELDPMSTAAAVSDLLSRKGATIDGVSATLGKTRRWVALRAQLAKLSPKMVKARDGGELAEWPAAWLAELAVLSPAEQDDLLRERWSLERVAGISDVRQLVAHRLMSLKEAPWDLTDAKLVPKQGPCSTCTRHSAATPDLFETAAAAKLETAVCRDSTCFAEKTTAWRAATVKAKRTELGDTMVVVHSANASGVNYAESQSLQKAAGQPIAHSYDYQRAKKGEKGAVPALTIDGPDQGTVRWVKKGRASSSTGGRQAAPKRPSSLKELREALDRRRLKAAALEAKALLEKLPHTELDGDEHLLELVCAFGIDPVEVDEDPEKGQSEIWPALHLAAIPRRKLLWDGIRKQILHRHLRDWMIGGEQTGALMADLCDSLRLPWKNLLAAQVEKIPEPKSWTDRGAAPAKKQPKAKVAKTPKGKRAKRG